MENQNKISELLEMCFYGHLDQVKNLVGQGVDVNSVGSNGMTPLKAARDGVDDNQDVIEYLLSVGAKDY